MEKIFICLFCLIISAYAHSFDHFTVLRPIPALDNARLKEQIVSYMEKNYQKIGEKLADKILTYNAHFSLGEENFSGMRWQKPYGYVNVSLRRNIKPDAHNPKVWVVDDEFTLTVDASTLLETLKKDGDINISATSLSAFAGLSYERVYKSSHIASSFIDGLLSDFTKLFLSPLTYEGKLWDHIDLDEILSREDQMVINAKIKATAPSTNGFTASGDVNYEKHVLKNTGIKRIRKAPESAFLKLSESKSIRTLGITGSAVWDFAELLQFVLASLDVKFDFEHSQKSITQVSGPNDDGTLLASEKIDNDGDNIRLQLINAHFLHSRHSSGVTLEDTNSAQFFYVSDIYTQQLIEHPLRYLSHSFIGGAINLDKQFSQALKYTWSAHTESISGDAFALSPTSASIKLHRDYETAFNGKLFSKLTLAEIKGNSLLAPEIEKAYQDKTLKSPTTLSTDIIISGNGIDHFGHIPLIDMTAMIEQICSPHLKLDAKICATTLTKKFKSYKETVETKKLVDLKTLEHFLDSLGLYSREIEHLSFMFGRENMQISGEFQATTKDGESFLTYFNDPEWKHNEIINQVKIQKGLKLPSSVEDKFSF